MAKKLYTDSISEFINWISGEDSITNRTVINTNNTPISGGSIRELIQSHLRQPFYVKEDEEEHVKRLFSSESSYNKWLQALMANDYDEDTLDQKYKDLVLLKFDIPAPHKLIIKKNGEGVDLGTINILEGSNDNGLLSFVYYLDDTSASTKAACKVTVTIYDNVTNAINYRSSRNCDAYVCDGKTAVEWYLGDYLKSGSNVVDIDIVTTDGTNAQPIHTSIQMNKISFNITLELGGNKSFNNPFTYGEDINFQIISTKSIMDSVTETIRVYVDDFSTIATNGPVITSGWNTLYSSRSITLTNNYALPTLKEGITNIKHKVLIQANIESLDHTINFDSNIIYFEFENAAQETDGINNNYINILTSIPTGTLETDSSGNNCLVAYQYNKFNLRWGYYTDSKGTNTNPNIVWKLRVPDSSIAGQDYRDIIISSLAGDNGKESDTLSFIPDTEYDVNQNAKLIATITKNNTDIVIFENPIIIIKSSYEMTFDEYKGYALKLNAYGRSNNESELSKNIWSFESSLGNYTTSFSEDFPWDMNNGWNNNSLSLTGIENYAIVNFNPFPSNISTELSIPNKGRAIEIDFMPTNVSSSDDLLAMIGSENGGSIRIYPSKTSLYVGDREVLTTNYKSNERIQLMFIFTPTLNQGEDKSAGNVYIINNGVLERGVGLSGSYTSLPDANGQIKFGGSNSGIKIYNIRVWWTQMSIYNAFLNYLYDCENKGPVISRNTMIDNSGTTIDYSECTTKLDTFLITGNLDNILNAGNSKEASESAVNITYTTIMDSNILGWDATDIKIRKHGQSTLNYPLTSFKIWLNQSKGENKVPKVLFKDQYKAKEYVKNRYTLRKNSIPANKFVLQANYADSSGVHNGGLLRLINDTWYNALIDGEYKLRTAPQLFTSGKLVHHNNEQLHEVEYDRTDPENPILVTDNSWIEGYGNTNKVFGGLTANENTWPQLAQAYKRLTELPIFPFQIRNAPDSLPCVVFYQRSVNEPKTYLGQFVFMDDKKSDHIYGERSIYLWDDIYDPFCMTHTGANTEVINSDGLVKKGYDRDANCVWDNKNVLRIECVLVNSSLTSFMDFNVSKSIEFWTQEEITAAESAYISDNVENMSQNDQEAWIEAHPAYGQMAGDPKSVGNETVPATSIRMERDVETGTDVPHNYYWEDYFELIFPDEDDIEETGTNTKFTGQYKTKAESEDPTFEWPANTSKFIKKTQPWVDFMRWICEIGQLNKKPNGDPYIDGTVTEAALNKFINEAHDHLDLYKMAAYYIFYIRFGLVDSVERNAQYKTYDGKHWFLEPWDMDIALGNKNTGGLVYDPPLDRNSKMPGNNEIWAYSGRSKTTSNVLWDCLEKWTYWIEVIVPKVADALYLAGLNYNNVVNVFDEEYANKWSEVLYNYSGMYKYVTAAPDSGWLSWLQGSRTSHRHWWLSTSLNYYDSKWTCGEFNQSRIYLAVNKAQGEEITIKFWPTSETFFKLTQADTTINLGLLPASPNSPATYNLTNNAFSAKDPTHIFGVLFLEKLDLGKFAAGIEKMIFQNAIDPVLGATIKELNIGSDIPTESPYSTGWVNGGDLTITNTGSIDETNQASNDDALENLEVVNITGQLKMSTSNIITNKRTKLKKIYAAGSGFNNLISSSQGNRFLELQLPAHNIALSANNTRTVINGVTTFDLNNSSWENLSFWDCEYNADAGWIDVEVQREDPETHETITVIEKQYNAPHVTYTKLDRITNNNVDYYNRIPENFTGVTFRGSTANNPCSAQFILDWFASIEYDVRQAHQGEGLTEAQIEQLVLDVIKTKKAQIYNIRWNYNVDANIDIDGELQPNPKYVKLTYKDMIRLGNLNGGINANNGISNNAGGTNFTGYIKISGDGGQLTSSQLAELIKYFGENVFTIGNINNNLVIDQDLNYARISISGDEGIEIIGDNIYVNENTPIKFRCTSFLLSTEDASAYTWDVVGGSFTGGFVGEGAYYQIVIDETAHDDVYQIEISADHNTQQSNTSLTLYVRPVSVCKNWKFMWVQPQSGSVPRQYNVDVDFAQKLFGQNYIYNSIGGVNTLCDTFILYSANMQNELYIYPNDNNPNNYTAKIKKFKFKFINIPNTDYNTNNFTLNTNVNGQNEFIEGKEVSSLPEFQEFNNGNPIRIDSDDSDPIIRYNKIATKYISQGTGIHEVKLPNGIVLETMNGMSVSFALKTEDMKLFQIRATIEYVSPAIQDQTYLCNIILYNDNSPIIRNNVGAGRCLINKLQTDYPGKYSSTTALYKSDLLSLKGTIDFAAYNSTNNTDVDNLVGLVGDKSIFDFMPYVKEINLTGTNYQFNGINNYFDFSKLKSLEVLNLTNATNAVTTITTTNSSSIKQVLLKGTNINLHAENNRLLEKITLGSPTTIYINLGENQSSFNINTFTCDSSTNLTSLTIINNNNINTFAYKLFDKIYNPS